MNLLKRKSQRLTNFDYRQNYAYFITICTQKKLHLFGNIVNGEMILNNAGDMVYEKLLDMPTVYHNLVVDNSVVMPNHIHAIILLKNDVLRTSGTTQGSFPTGTLSYYIQRYKSLTTKLYIDGVKIGAYPPFDKKVWQKSYHDHIIRNETDYKSIWEYIESNPLRWEMDKYY